MALEKSVVSWPITGGIDSKKAPIMLQPGSNLVLDNVRQERLNEWRTRAGHTRDTNDALPGANVPVMLTEAPWGGLVGLCREATALETAGRVYTPDVLPRWNLPTVFTVGALGPFQSCAQQTPSMWNRKAISPTDNVPVGATEAEGDGYRLAAWCSQSAAGGISVSFGAVDGASLTYFQQFTSPTAIRPKAVYSPTSKMLVLFWSDPTVNRITVQRWSTTTGLLVGGQTAIATNASGVDPIVDAIQYSGSATITVAYRDNVATGGLRQLEYNPTTAVATIFTPGIDASKCISLLQDPDATGIRYIAVTTATPEVRVVRTNATGVIQTNHLADAVDAVNIAGVAYSSGWMIVYTPVGFLQPWAVKRTAGGVTSAPLKLSNTSQFGFALATNAWREAGTDAMRYVLSSLGTTGDVQHTYFEMALEYANGTNTITNQWPEPQARMLPLNGGSVEYYNRGALPQVQRTGTDRYVTVLPRITRINPSNVGGFEYAIDAWTCQYLNSTTRTGFNQGPGTLTQDDAFLPAGSLLQTGTGQLLCSLGGSMIPAIATFTAGSQTTGTGALTVTDRYSFVVSIEMFDEHGNRWRSERSVPRALTLTGTNNTVAVNVLNSPFENLTRRRLVRLWMTEGNGSAYHLIKEMNGDILSTNDITFNIDNGIDDAAISAGELLNLEIQATVTPSFAHVAVWGGRMWGALRDFPSQIMYSKPIQAGFLPEFPAEFITDTADQYGDITALRAMDDRIVACKAQATYVNGTSATPDNNGNGGGPSFTRISSETGAIAGGPTLATGAEVYLTSAGGVFSLDRSQNISFVGSPIDQFLSMPLLSTPETVIGMVLSPSKNEVRVQTTHYRLVHDRVFNVWYRDTGGFSLGTIALTRMVNGRQVLITTGGDMWYEAGDSVAPDDAGTTYQGVIRSPWVRPSGVGGWLRLYRARVLDTVTASGTVGAQTLTIFRDDDDTLYEAFTPSTTLTGVTGLVRGEARPQQQRCTSFSLQLTLPTTNATVRLEEWWVVVGAKAGAPPLASGQRWGAAAVVPPPPAAPSLLPVPLVSTTPTLLTGNLTGTLSGNQRDLMIQVLNAWLAGGWFVVQSYNANGIIPAPGVNTWLTAADIKGSGGGGTGFSWIVLGNPDNAFQLCFYCTVSGGWLELQIVGGPGGGFTGGTTGARPTAPGEMQDDVLPSSFLGTGPAGNPQFYAVTWVASDHGYLRTAFFYNGMLRSVWQFDKLRNTPTGYTKCLLVGNFHWGNPSYAVVGNRASTDIYQKNWGISGSWKQLLIPGPDTLEQANAWLESFPSIVDQFTVANPYSNQWFWLSPLGYVTSGHAAAQNGVWGYSIDQWWTSAGFTDGDTMGDAFDFIILGQMVLQWGIGAVGSRLGGSSTNYPTARWNGRSTL